MATRRCAKILALTLATLPGMLAAGAAPALAASWQQSPEPALPGSSLAGVAAVSANDAWAAGQDGNGKPLMEHWGGSSWTVVGTPALPAAGSFQSVSGDSKKDVWAVGDMTLPSGEEDVLAEHWNGKKWKVTTAQNLFTGDPTDQNSLRSVQVLSPTDVWAVGGAANAQGKHVTLVERWNGSSWSVVSSPGDGMTGVSMASDAFGWAAGAFGNKIVASWNGSTWTATRTPPGLLSFFNGVLTESPTTAWAVGGQAHGIDPTAPLIERFAKSKWKVVPAGTSDFGTLHAIAALTPDDIWAVGGDTSSSTRSLLLHWNGTAWSQDTGPSVSGNPTLLSVAAVPGTSQLWAVGFTDAGPLIERYA